MENTAEAISLNDNSTIMTTGHDAVNKTFV